MPKILTILPLMAVLGLGSAVYAQETATETTGDTATGTVADTLDMGTEVAPQEDPTYVKETYQDWQLKCFKSETEEELCQMYQLLREDAGNPIAEVSIFRLPEGSQAVAGATIVVPLGTLIPEQLKIAVDGGKAKSFGYSFCSLIGCFARVGLTQGDVDAFKRGLVASLTIVPAQAPDQTVDIKASLKGFTAAFENVSTIAN